jgi:hypothetical protein
MAITATGVDQVEQSKNRISPNLLLDDRHVSPSEDAEEIEVIELLSAK